MGLMGSLYIGVSGLQTGQNALNTTAHNMSNIDTTGYTRQQVQQGTRSYNILSKTASANAYQETGLGVNYSQVKQVRDYFLDKTYRQENGRSAFYDTSVSAIEEVEDLLQELQGETFSEGIQNLWKAVQELSKDPSNSVNQGVFVQRCNEFITRGKAVYEGLAEYQDNLNSVFTLAHEMGHALHSYYSDHNQPYVYAGYRIFVAEVASTCNEALLIRHLIDQAKDRKEKMYLINYFLEQFRTTLYRQTMFAEFEKLAHAQQESGGQLTADWLCETYYTLNKKYFGEDMVVDEEIAMEWARIPHFYTPFYVYQYATGFSAAIALSGRILKEGAPAVEDYKKFLKGGCSAYPTELLRMAGVDMESTAPITAALQVFGQYVEELENLL